MAGGVARGDFAPIWRRYALSQCGSAPGVVRAQQTRRPTRLADYLPWAALVAPRVVLNKDSSSQPSMSFGGPDLDSATDAELVAATARLNNALKRLGSGWALYVDTDRHGAPAYPESDF